ncbi:MAG: DEAD/DEAH box helicase [Candidatus Micrarchaeia archaeon]
MHEKEIYKYFLSKFKEFSKIQKLAIPEIEKGNNCIITAPTGTGKTEAAMLPVLEKLRESQAKTGIEAIYITPLRSLNRDLLKRLEEICGRFDISIGIRHGDTSQKERSLQTKSPPQLLITTPETLQIMLITKSFRKALRNVRYVIVDELHELYYNKRGAQLSIALERLKEIAGPFQRIGVSATVGDLEEAAKFLDKSNCKIIKSNESKENILEVELPKKPVQNYKNLIEKFDLDSESAARIEEIASLIEKHKKSIIFVNTRQIAESLGSKLIYMSNYRNIGKVAIHHSSLDKEERTKVEDSFKKGLIKSIIATSSLELGIDIGDVDLVIQYGSPKQVTRLIQRVGRSGHGVEGSSHGRIIVGSIIDALESGIIAKLAIEKKVERRSVEDCPADVVANQAAAMALEYGEIEKDRLYKIIAGAYPFRNITKEKLDLILDVLNNQRIIKINGEKIIRGSRGLKYFFSNISVIPDISRFFVKNAVTNKIISTLDEKFVASYIEEGIMFISKGLPWNVISIDENTIYVEPSTSLDAAIPDWEGEDIPVSFEVASGTFELLENCSLDGIKSFLIGPLKNNIEEFFEMQNRFFRLKKGEIPVEIFDDYAVIYMPIGRLANELFGKLIGSIFTADSGSPSIKTTPYAIIIDFSLSKKRPNIVRNLELLKEYGVNTLIGKNELISRSELFRYKFVQIAKLFGILEKNATVTKNIAERLIAFYKNSVVYDETTRDLYKNYYDIEKVREIIKELKEYKLIFKLYEFGSQSPLATEIIRSSYHYKELILPTLPDGNEIREFAEGTERKKVELVCTFCGFEFSKIIGDVKDDEEVTCPSCKSKMIAVYREEYLPAIKKMVNGEKLTDKEKVYYEEAVKSASLVSEYSKKALIALTTYGIGLKTAARVLKNLRHEYKNFVIDLIEAQKNYIKYRKFWKDK